MRICPFLMFSQLFQEAVSKAREIMKQPDLNTHEREKHLQDIFQSFICPAHLLAEAGMVCSFYQLEEKQGQEVESCQAGLFNFQLNLQQGPQIPPGLMSPGFKL